MIVLDASVAVKWFRYEPLSEQAEALLIGSGSAILAPDQFAVEVAAALVRNANVNKSVGTEMREALERFAEMLDTEAIELIRLTSDQLTSAAAVAIDLGHPLKDCLYLALAMEIACPLVTADARFAAKARAVWDRVQVLGD